MARRRSSPKPAAAPLPVDSPPAPSAPGYERFGWVLAALVAFVIYLPALSYEFTIDDLDIVLDNPRIRDLSEPAAYLGSSWWDKPNLHKEYRPATMATFALNHAMHGVAPFGYHLANNMLHAANAALVWLLVWRFAARRRRRGMMALLAGLLFAIHPVHIEAVAGIVGRAEEMATTGYLLGLIAALASFRAETPAGRWGFAGAGLAATLLSVFSKEHGVTLPAAVVLLALIEMQGNEIRHRGSRGFDLKSAAPALGLTVLGVALYFMVRAAVLGSMIRPEDSPIIPTANPLVMLPAGEQRIGALSVLARIWSLFALPFRPSSDYSYRALDPVELAGSPLALAGLGILVAAVAGLIFWRGRPEVRLGLALILAPLPVYSNLVIMTGTILGERLLYLPSAGVCMVAAALVVDPFGSVTRRRALLAGCMIWSTALLAQHFRYLPTWRNPRTVLDYSIVRVPECSNVQFGYALELFYEEKLDEAIEHLNEALRIWPHEPTSYGWRGVMLARVRRDEEALRDLVEFRKLIPGWALANDALAMILTERGQLDEAERVLREGVATDASGESEELLRQWLAATGRGGAP